MKGSQWIKTLPMKPGIDRENCILKAVEDGHYFIRWTPLVMQYEGLTVTIDVMADSLRIGDQEDSIRVICSYRTAQQIADILDAMLPTTKIVDAIWLHADVRAGILTQTPDEYMADTDRMILHHYKLEDDTRDYAGGLWTAGKDWVLTSRIWKQPNRAANYGWIDSKGKAIQPLGLAHDLNHTDYSQMPRFVSRTCDANGNMADIRDVITDKKLSWCINDDGPLPSYRHPSVPVIRGCNIYPDSKWKDSSLSLGERAVEFAYKELTDGIAELPKGSNDSPRIREYFRPATRLVNGKETPLGVSHGNWCAASACYCAMQSLLPGETMPHPYRVSGAELEADSIAAKTWMHVSEVRNGYCKPVRGDLVIFHREGWHRHVARVIEPLDGESYMTIGGNESDRWNIAARRLSDNDLRGFVHYPAMTDKALRIAQDDIRLRLFALAREIDAGEPSLAEILRRIDEQNGIR